MIRRPSIGGGSVARGPPLRLAATIAHELAHNFGYRHKSNKFRTRYYGNTVPEQVEACVRNGTVTAGSTKQLHQFRIKSKRFKMPPGKRPTVIRIVISGMAHRRRQ